MDDDRRKLFLFKGIVSKMSNDQLPMQRSNVRFITVTIKP